MDTETLARLAAELRERMVASGLNQAQFAAHMGVSKATVSEVLAGRGRSGLSPVARAILRFYPDLLPLFLESIAPTNGDSPHE
jgi:transcriptional regulator with XRE-family HTH domain